jgi:hypothetical protein
MRLRSLGFDEVISGAKLVRFCASENGSTDGRMIVIDGIAARSAHSPNIDLSLAGIEFVFKYLISGRHFGEA